MKRFRVSDQAKRDLDDVFLYWANRAGPQVANRLIDGIVERFWILGQYPGLGRPCDDIARGVKCFPAGKYLIYYRKIRSGVEIAHIFHGARLQKEAWQRTRRDDSTK
jgi:toxin ParE1/3/4